MKLYLDNSFLNRPFDNLDIKTNKLEAEILFFIIRLVKRKRIILVNSAVIEYENSLNPHPERKIFVREILKMARVYQNLDEKIKKHAIELQSKMNLSPIDSLHLATAEEASVDFFITCDYNLIKKYKGKIKIISPLKFLEDYENTN